MRKAAAAAKRKAADEAAAEHQAWLRRLSGLEFMRSTLRSGATNGSRIDRGPRST